jgi:hypothetical protein
MGGQVSHPRSGIRVGDMTMIRKPKKTNGEPTPTETSQPGQQMQDDGSQNPGESFTDGEGGTGTSFANINPAEIDP